MTKKIFTLLTAIVLCSSMSWAQSSSRKAPQATQYTTDKVASSGVSASLWDSNNDVVILSAGKKNSNGYLQMPIYAPVGYRDANNVPYAGFYTTYNTCSSSDLTYGQVWADLNCNFRGQVKLYDNLGYLAFQFLFKGGQTVRIRKSGPALSNVYVIYDGNTWEDYSGLGNTTIRYQAGTNNTTTYGSYDINVANSVVDKSDASNYIFESVAANSDGYSVRVQVPKSATNLNSIVASLFQGYNYFTYIKKNGQLIEVDDITGRIWQEYNKWYFEIAMVGVNRMVYNVTNYSTYVPENGSLTLNAGSNGQVSFDGTNWSSSSISSATLSGGTNVTIEAKGNDGYIFSQWNDGNTDNPRTIVVDGDATYTAKFVQCIDIDIDGSFTNKGSYFTLTGENETYSLDFESKADKAYFFRPGQYGASDIWNGSSLTNKTTNITIDNFDIRSASVSRVSWYYTTNIILGRSGDDCVYRIVHRCNAPLNDYSTISLRDDLDDERDVSIDAVNVDVFEDGDAMTYYVDDNDYYGVTLRFYVDKTKNGKIPTGVYPINASKEVGTVLAMSNYTYYDNKFYDEDDFEGSIAWCGYSQPYKKGWLWMLVEGTVEVINTNETYFVRVNAINSINYPIKYTIGSAPVSSNITLKLADENGSAMMGLTGGTTTYSATTTGVTQSFYNGQELTLTATHNEGYRFKQWKEDGNTNATRTVIVNGTATYTAEFESTAVTHKVTFMNGTTTLQEDQVAEGKTPVYTKDEPTKASTVSTIYTFSGWKSSIDEQVYATASLPKVGSSDVIYTAQFSETTRQYEVTITAPTNGTIKVMNGNTEVHTSDKVDYNTVLTVTTTPSTGYHFDAWTTGEDYVTPNEQGQVIVMGDIKLGATFSIDQFTLKMDACTGGTYSVTYGGETKYTGAAEQTFTIDYNTFVTLSAEPATGYEFKGWIQTVEEEEAPGFDDEPGAPRRAPMEGIGGIGGGSGIGGGIAGTVTYASETTPWTFEMTQGVGYKADFAVLSYEVTIEACEHGTIRVEQAGKTQPLYEGTAGTVLTIPYNTELTITAIADTENHYEFKSWTGNGAASVTVDGEKTIGATFGKEQVTFTVAATNGSINVTDAQKNVIEANEANSNSYTVDYGTVVFIKAQANTGYYFDMWSDEEIENPYEKEVTYTFDLTANFAANFVLIDNKSEGNPWYDTYAEMVTVCEDKPISVTFERTFTAGNWTVFSLPFIYSFLKPENQTFRDQVYEFDNAMYDEGYLQLNFIRQNAYIEANKPYLLHPFSTIENPIFENVRLVDIEDATYEASLNGTDHQVKLINTTYYTTLPESKNIIFLNQNTLYYPSKPQPFRAFRGYFDLGMKDDEIKHAPKIRIVVEGEEVMNLEDEAAEEFIKKYFDESGNLIIENNGVKYDAQGKQL